MIGFAAETDNLVENSKKKLDEKNCDWIIANDVSNNEIGFDSDYNEITIFYRNKNLEKISKMKKSLIADKIVSFIRVSSIIYNFNFSNRIYFFYFVC